MQKQDSNEVIMRVGLGVRACRPPYPLVLCELLSILYSLKSNTRDIDDAPVWVPHIRDNSRYLSTG